MSSTSDYNELISQIQSIPSVKALRPTMPVDVYLQEAEDLYLWCLADQDALVGAGLDATLINELPVRAGACREAQSLWVKNRRMRNHTSVDWKLCLSEATDLRSQLLHAFRYAFRAHDGLLSGIGEIAKSNSRSAIVQDLNDLSVLGNSKLDLLKAIRMDITLLQSASLKSYQMGDMAGSVNSARRRKSDPQQSIRLPQRGYRPYPPLREIRFLAESQPHDRLHEQLLEAQKRVMQEF